MGMNMVGAFDGSAETVKDTVIKPRRYQGDKGILCRF